MKLLAAAQLFRGLSDGTRLRILNALAQADKMSGTQLADLLRVPRARVARHLRYLYRSRLVITERRGAETRYAIRTEHEAIHLAVSRILSGLLSDIEGLAKDNEKLRRLARGQ